MRIAFLMFVLATQLAPNTALAQSASERLACKGDYEKFCKGVEQGDGRVLQCLSEHMGELTPECQKVVKAHVPG